MRMFLASLLLAVVARANIPEDNYLISIPETPNPDEIAAQLLEDKFDVRGVYNGLVVVVGSGSVVSDLEGRYPLVDTVGRYIPRLRSYYMLMRTPLPTDTVHTPGEWDVASREALVLMSSVEVMNSPVPDRIFVSVPLQADRELMDGLLKNTEVLQVLPQTVKPLANSHPAEELKVFRQDTLANLLTQVSQENLRTYANYITGASTDSVITTRNSYSINNPTGLYVAVGYIETFLQELGWQVELHPFRNDMGPNIVAVWPGQTDEIVIWGAHYDSRGPQNSSPTQLAPGANDDGSGTVALMEVARIISENRAQFRASVHLNFYCGEEQGLIGSGALAQRYLDRRENVIAMLQADMMAYRLVGPLQLSLADDSADENLVAEILEVTEKYVPGLELGRTFACCSDQRSFFVRGFSTAQFFENIGGIEDPMYHSTGDIVDREGYNFDQFELQVQSFLASGAVKAGLLN